MKKIIFSILSIGMLVASCAKFDEPTNSVFGAGPSIEVSQPVVADSTFTFTVTPGAKTNFYTYAVVESASIEDIDAEDLLKDQVECLTSSVQQADSVPTVTETMSTAGGPLCEPNTTYVIYAVAADANGIPGAVKAVKVTTSDGVSPDFDAENVAKTDTTCTVTFNEAIARGEGKVTAQYYVEWGGDDRFVDVPADSITVDVQGNTATFSAKGVPTHCYVLFSYETGAFEDNVGNKCNSVTSGLNEEGTDFEGIYYMTASKSFDITDENIKTPEPGKINDWQQDIVISFDQPIYQGYAANDIKITYTNDSKTTTYTVKDWVVGDDNITFNLPEEPSQNDVISITIPEGIINDVYGNTNNEKVFSKVYTYDKTVWNLVGVGTYTYYPFYGNEDGSGYDDPEQKLYVNADDPTQFMLSNWLGGYDFIFNVATDGSISWEPFKCYYWEYYSDYVWAYNREAEGEDFKSYYDSATGVYHFQIDYYLDAVTYDWTDDENDETFVLNSSAKARRSAAKSVNLGKAKKHAIKKPTRIGHRK